MKQPHLAIDLSDPASTPTDRDHRVLAAQLGRPARAVAGIAARCACGNPVVVRTHPRLEDGTPFPTTFYLTHPGAVAAVSRLEAEGLMREYNEQLSVDPSLAQRYRLAHENYLQERSRLAEVSELVGISAGGMPTRVKCLHVLVGHALGAGSGTNPLGDDALERISEQWSPFRCVCLEQGK